MDALSFSLYLSENCQLITLSAATPPPLGGGGMPLTVRLVCGIAIASILKEHAQIDAVRGGGVNGVGIKRAAFRAHHIADGFEFGGRDLRHHILLFIRVAFGKGPV